MSHNERSQASKGGHFERCRRSCGLVRSRLISCLPASRAVCGEVVYSVALSSEGRAIAAHRFNHVVVRRSRRKVHHKHAVDHIREILIPPVRRFRPAIEVLGVRAVAHHRVLDQAAASVCRPSDNGGIIRRRFQFRSFDDPHSRGFITSRTLL